MDSSLNSVAVNSKFKFSVLLFSIFLSASIFAQDAEHLDASQKQDGGAHGMKGTHRLTLGLGHTRISHGKIDGKTKWVPVASWTLNYDYWLSDNWALGLQNDLILETFVVEHGKGKELERKNPLAVVPVVLYKFSKHWTVVGGVGAEFSEGHTITMTRLGIEYGWHLPKNWELGIAVVWDEKWNYYNSYGLSFVFSKLWPKTKAH